MDPFSRRLASLSASLRTGAAVGAAAAAGDEQQEIVIIVGGGPGISGACARLFAEVGMLVAIAQRTPEKPAIKQLIKECPAGRVHAYQCDASDADSVAALFEAVQRDHAGRIRCVVYNPSGRARGPVVELDPEEVKQALLVTAYGGFLVGQKAAQTMLEHGQGGSILFTGASASYKGYPNSSSFAMGKFGLTGMAQSMARELAPQGIHVAHFPIDGGVGEIDYRCARCAQSADSPACSCSLRVGCETR
jgi:NAD(P)-dependent dehydrogenase (short-subunit alcohol dehydrogenase family)